MGVFFQATPTTSLQKALREALERDPGDVQNPAAEAATIVGEVVTPPQTLKTANVIGAFVIFGLLVVAALLADASPSLDESVPELYGFAGTVLGVIVGFLGGEKTSGG